MAKTTKQAETKREGRKSEKDEAREFKTHGTRKKKLSGVRSRFEVSQYIKDKYPSDNQFQWVNDEDGAKEELVDRGWVETLDEKNQPVKQMVGRARGDGVYAYLMTTCYDIWKEDFDAKQELNMRPLTALKQGREDVDVARTSGDTYAPNLDDGKTGFSESTETISS